MLKPNPLFELPERLEYGRPYGQHDIIKEKSAKHEIQTDLHSTELSRQKIPGSTLYKSELSNENDEIEIAENVLTVVGILPNEIELLEKYFHDHNLDPEVLNENRGNWVCLGFDFPVESLDIIQPTIQLHQHLIVSCFVGYFQKGKCREIRRNELTVVKDKKLELFKIKKMDEDLVLLPFEEKTFFTKFREFFLGTKEIPRKKGTLLGLLSECFSNNQ